MTAPLVVVSCAGGDSEQSVGISSYQVSDDGLHLTLMVSVGAEDAFTAVHVDQDSSQVQVEIEVEFLVAGGYQPAIGYARLIDVDLEEPLGDRTVISARSGEPVQRLEADS